jgi:hypothetical protein
MRRESTRRACRQPARSSATTCAPCASISGLSCTGSISEALPVLVAATAPRFTRCVDRGSAQKTRPWDYDAGRKVCRVYHGFEVTPISCSEPSNSGESFGPEALN